MDDRLERASFTASGSVRTNRTGAYRSAQNERAAQRGQSRWTVAAALAVALLGAVATQAIADSPRGKGPATILAFDKMAPVTGPYVGSANPVRGLAGGGLPWMIRSATGSLRQNGHVLVIVRGLVLAKASSVPAALRGKNPVPDFRAIVSCQAIGS